MGDNLDSNQDLNGNSSNDQFSVPPSIQSLVNRIEGGNGGFDGFYGRLLQPQRQRNVINDASLNNRKWDTSPLAKALGTGIDGNKKIDNDSDGGDTGSYFDCNVCLDIARDPVLTCCGHLFCWTCYYRLPYDDFISKECPVCEGKVIDSNVIPIYGNGNGTSSHVSESESMLRIPPRPRAKRVRSARLTGIHMGNTIVPVADILRRMRMDLGL